MRDVPKLLTENLRMVEIAGLPGIARGIREMIDVLLEEARKEGFEAGRLNDGVEKDYDDESTWYYILFTHEDYEDWKASKAVEPTDEEGKE